MTTRHTDHEVTVDASDDVLSAERAHDRLSVALFILLAYVPVLLTDTGKTVADSKSYLYLDPGRFLANVSSIWNPQIGMGTVDHQVIGYLFPLGPFYWILEQVIGLPPWVAERLWLGTLICLAGLGTRYLLRALGVRGAGVPVAMLAYGFSPYVVQFSPQLSVLLGPWAALPWMTAFVVLALRRGGWKYPALLAMAVQLAGSVNGSSLIFVLLGPALWIPYSLIASRESDWRRAWSVIWRTGALILLTSLWWISGLLVESKYGLDVLRFTETLKQTSSTTSPIEVLRGLGYWPFYIRDRAGQFNPAVLEFTRNPAVIISSLLLPALALLGAVAVRWRYRAYFVLLVVIGVTVAVGAAPYGHPSPIAAAFKALAGGSSVGLALRNSARAVPLIVLGLAVLLAAGVSALDRQLRAAGLTGRRIIAVGVVGALCLANAPGLWGGSYYSSYLEWSSVPSYWQQALHSLNAQPHDTRVLALPGSPFAAYLWGAVEDPIEPGLMSRPFVTRQQVPVGSEATADLLQALDERLQRGELAADALAPVARLMGVGDVLLDMDLQTGRYGLLPASQLWQTFTQDPPIGLAAPQKFGPGVPSGLFLLSVVGDVARLPTPSPPRLAVLSVDQPLPIVRTKPDADPLVVDGSGDGLVDLSSAGLLDARRLVVYSASYERDPVALRALPPGASLVVTDSNRKQVRSTAFLNNEGPLLQAGERPLLQDPLDQPFDVFPGATDASRTVLILQGVRSVQATAGIQAFAPIANRPSKVLDGDLTTAWLVDSGVPVGPERLRIQFDKPITTDHINLVQPLPASQGRWIDGVTLSFDGGHDVRSGLGASSRTGSGQDVKFPVRTFSTLEIRIDRVHELAGAPEDPVGFAEVRVADDVPGAQFVHVTETTRMPLDLLDALGSSSIDHALTLLMSRDQMDDTAMSRQFSLPTARSFALSGTAELGSLASDDALDRRLGLPGAGAGGVTVTSSGRFTDPLARGSSAIDGDLTTAWNTPPAAALGWIRVQVPQPITFDHLDLRLVDDGRHSVPTKLKITSDNGSTRILDLTGVAHTRGADGTVSVPVHFGEIRGRQFTFTIADVDKRKLKTPDGPAGITLPSGIAELGIPGVTRAPVPAQLPSDCINDLLTIDGKPFPVRVTGSTADALRQRSLSVQPCEPGNTIKLDAGTHLIRARVSPDTQSGLDIQQLVLASSARGASPPTASATGAPQSSASAPPVRVVHQGATSMTLRVDPASEPFWLVVGQSYNRGWQAKADGHDLGPSTLVDGYANGWLVRPGTSGQPINITLDWTPQRVVDLAVPLSAAGLLLCLAVVGVALARDRRRRAPTPAPGAAPTLGRKFRTRALERRRGAVIGTVVATGAAATLLVNPWIGPPISVIVLLAILRSRWHQAMRLAPAVIVTAVAVYVTLTQILRNYAAVIQWPTYFDPARIPIWIALVLLGADAIIAIVWRTEIEDVDGDVRGS
jgi:arabinofuranan 3-O-arabinosyltransferase